MNWNEMQWTKDLLKDIRTPDDAFNWDERQNPSLRKYMGNVEVTAENRAAISEYFLKVRDTAKAVLEIGVSRNGEQSTTQALIDSKKDETIYIGIDVHDKSFLNNPSKNIYTICNTSNDVEANMEKMRSWGVTEFDFIFIDGNHSINQVLIDWEYTKWLSKTGIVGFHDTNEHPGPYLFIRNLDSNKWVTLPDLCPNDWGVGVAWRK